MWSCLLFLNPTCLISTCTLAIQISLISTCTLTIQISLISTCTLAISNAPFSSHNQYKLNLFLNCFQRGFIAQLIEYRTGIIGGSWIRILLEPQNYLWALFVTAYFITVKMYLTCILYKPQCTHIIFIIYTSNQ